jgi:predicted amidohydrolase YtcJ
MIHPYRTAIDMGTHVAGHSDSTVSAADPLLRIQDMVTRQGEDGKTYGVNQRVTVDEAIRVWTLDGAYATFEEKTKGSITVGKLADFVVLRKDPRTVAKDSIKDIVVEATYVGGENVWQAPAKMTAGKKRMVPGIDFGDGDEMDNVAAVNH